VDNGSSKPLGDFIAEAPAGVARIVTPSPAADWMTASRFMDMAAAIWTPLGFNIPAGGHTADLTFEAVGLPGIVRFWATGGMGAPDTIVAETSPRASTRTPATRLTPAQELAQVGVELRTVGVVPVANRTPAALATRLGGLIRQACDLQWIRYNELCFAMRQNARADRARLQALLQQLSSSRGHAVTEEAFQLLRPNIEYLLSRL
jgi:hypothetical protein